MYEYKSLAFSCVCMYIWTTSLAFALLTCVVGGRSWSNSVDAPFAIFVDVCHVISETGKLNFLFVLLADECFYSGAGADCFTKCLLRKSRNHIESFI